MKFIRGIVHSALIGTRVEYHAVRKLLKFDDNDSYLNTDGTLYTGLLDFVRDRLGEYFPIELEDLFSYDHPSIKDIVIPPDYLSFDEPEHKLRSYQITAAKKAIAKGRGILELATGCFVGSTKVSLLSGEEVAIQDLVGRREFWVYSVNSEGELVPGRGHSARVSKFTSTLTRVMLDSGDVVECTPDHKFLTRDLQWVQAKDLKPGTSLYPKYCTLNDNARKKSGRNHRVETVTTFECVPTPVYDITVDKYSNFALTAGVVVHNSGKTEVAAVIAKYLLKNKYAKKVFFVAETRFLMNQAATRLEKRGLDGVRRLGGGHSFESGKIQVCVVDSLLRALRDEDEEVCSEFAECDVLIMDEVQHLQAKSWIEIAEGCPARYRYGLTATVWSDPFRYSYSDFKLLGLTGGVIIKIPSVVLRKQGLLAEPHVTVIDVNYPAVYNRKWQDYYYAGIVRHPRRNSYILSLAQSLYEGNYKTLIFVKMINHGLRLARLLREQGCEHTYFVKGGEQIYSWKPSGRWEVAQTSVEQLADLVREEPAVNILGTSVIDEGVDIPHFNALILGTAMKKYRRTVQRAGRGMRPKELDNNVYIFDFIDSMHAGLFEHSRYRMETYRLEEYYITSQLLETCNKMGTPLLLEDGLYSWMDEFSGSGRGSGRRKKRRKKS